MVGALCTGFALISSNLLVSWPFASGLFMAHSVYKALFSPPYCSSLSPRHLQFSPSCYRHVRSTDSVPTKTYSYSLTTSLCKRKQSFNSRAIMESNYHEQNSENSHIEKLKESIKEVTDENIDVAINKYDNLADELYAKIDFAQINAFTDSPFGGNPAAVCYLPYERDSKWMQLVARQFNLSETAFLVKRRASEDSELSNDNEFDLRWFTPTVEVDLCGHATLAAAHLIFTSRIVITEEVVFHTKSGVLKAKNIKSNGEKVLTETGKSKKPIEVGVIELDFPLDLPSSCNLVEVQKLSSILGTKDIVWAGKTSLGDYLVEVPTEMDVKTVQPNYQNMLDLEGRGGLIVTSAANSSNDFDFISRFFCPKSGITEDPVTGSAHCTLGPFWEEKLHKNTLEAYQASERGGRLTVKVDRHKGRAYLQGDAVIVMLGVLLNTNIDT